MAHMTPDEGAPLYVHTHGGLVRVVAICGSVDEANAYMTEHPGTGVISSLPKWHEAPTCILLADCDDKGLPFPR